jgi:hypothetical protein
MSEKYYIITTLLYLPKKYAYCIQCRQPLLDVGFTAQGEAAKARRHCTKFSFFDLLSRNVQNWHKAC